jgi:hypothetical protein
MLPRLTLLPQTAVAPVVAYYAADAALNTAIKALRMRDFRRLGAMRQLQWVEAFFMSIEETYPVAAARAHRTIEARRSVHAWKAARALHQYAAHCRREVEAVQALEAG